MNGNRGQYTSAPLYHIKPKHHNKPASGGSGDQEPRPARTRYRVLSVILSVALPLLFLLALLVPNNTLRWVFLIATGLSLAAMWLMRAFVKNARSTLTIVYLALAVVVGLALFMNNQSPESRSRPASRVAQDDAFTNNDAASLGALLNTETTPAPTDAVNVPISVAQQQLEGFLAAWGTGVIPDMLQYCLPSWVGQQQSPSTALYQITMGSTPLNYQIENVSGSDGDSSRTIAVRVSVDEHNGMPSVLKRMQVRMARVNNMWYVDPNSLGGTVIDEAAESELASREMPASTIAPSPSPTPEGYSSGITLYYNKNGGKYYHASATCEAVDQSYWPLTGEFPYELLNSEQYKHLKRCEKCNAPARPPVGQ